MQQHKGYSQWDVNKDKENKRPKKIFGENYGWVFAYVHM